MDETLVRLRNLERQIQILAERQGNRANNNESTAKNAEGKATSNEVKIAEVSKDVTTNEEALDYVIEEMIPAQEEASSDLESTLDYILTELLPNIVSGD